MQLGLTNVYRSFSATPDVAARVDALLKEHGCVVFSKSTCPFCMMAKQVLQADLQAKFHLVEMDREMPYPEVAKMQDHFLTLTGARSVPRVFIGGKCIGGGSEVTELHAKGKLRPLLEEHGAL